MQPRDYLDLDQSHEIYDGDELRNINSYEYLKKIVEAYKQSMPDPAPPITDDDLDNLYPFIALVEIFERQEHQAYNPEYPYGDLYTRFLLELENNIENLEAFKLRLARIDLDQQGIQQREILRARIQEKLDKARSDLALYTNNPLFKEPSYRLMAKGLIEKANQDIEAYRAQLARSPSEVLVGIIDTCIDTVYANPNKGLERAGKMVDEVVQRKHQTSSEIESSVRRRLKGKGKGSKAVSDHLNYVFHHRDKNKVTPQHEGGDVARLGGQVAMTFGTYKPQTTTSMASVRNYGYMFNVGDNRKGKYPIEYRFGTQGQYVPQGKNLPKNQARVSPMFESWLKVQAKKNPPQGDQRKITHIYFNNLAKDRTDREGRLEVGLTDKLHDLEERHPNLAVITLPADKGLFDKKLLEKHERDIPVFPDAFYKMFNIAIGTSTEQVKDLYISPEIKKLLYGDPKKQGDQWDTENENKIVFDLLKKSFEALGLKDMEKISPAEMQAVYFHFIKYELTNFIIEKLQPDSFNMSCKDAIDRGGVSSAYYNLMKSIEAGEPLSKDEFHRALHAAPTLVKGRGMNHHTMLIWNAVDKYINQFKKDHAQEPEELQKVKWLEEWRDENAPKKSKVQWAQKISDYIQKRVADKREHNRVMGSDVGIDRQTKLLAATKLKRLVNNPESDVTFTKAEVKALQQGRLGALFKELVKAKVVSKDQIKIKEPSVEKRKALDDTDFTPTRPRGRSF